MKEWLDGLQPWQYMWSGAGVGLPAFLIAGVTWPRFHPPIQGGFYGNDPCFRAHPPVWAECNGYWSGTPVVAYLSAFVVVLCVIAFIVGLIGQGTKIGRRS